MLGLCEERMEVHQVMDDMRSADIDFMTMGQYLQLTPKHAKVIDFVTPQAFDAYAQIARAKGFLQVASSPLTRSSYHAGDDFERMRPAREAQLARVDRKRVVSGKSVSVRVDLGGRRNIIKKKQIEHTIHNNSHNNKKKK